MSATTRARLPRNPGWPPVGTLRSAMALCLMAISASCGMDSPPPGQDSLVIDHVTILDGRGGAPIIDARVLVRGGRIVSISRSRGRPIAGAQVIDGAGRFLLPGYIDMHAHLLFPRCADDRGHTRFDRPLSERALSRQLDFGVTTVRSPATPTIEGLRLRDDLNAGRVRGPRAFASAEVMNDAGMSSEQLRQMVRDAHAQRADYVKVYAGLSPAQVATVIDEAHRHGLQVIGHLQRTSWAQGAALGIDHLVHSVDWSSESLPPAARGAYGQARRTRSTFRSRIDWLEAFDPDAPAQRALASALARRQLSVDITLVAYDARFAAPGDGRYRLNPYLRSFPELRSDWQACNETAQVWTRDDYERWHAARPKLSAWIRRMNDAGVLLVTGTDLTNEWIAPGDGLHQEFELLAQAGLAPNEILRMTGANAAKALRSVDVGIVEPGRRADLVLLSADPRISIRNTRTIVWVMQGGRIVARGEPGT